MSYSSSTIWNICFLTTFRVFCLASFVVRHHFVFFLASFVVRHHLKSWMFNSAPLRSLLNCLSADGIYIFDLEALSASPKNLSKFFYKSMFNLKFGCYCIIRIYIHG
jgi:hypothetical protein